MARYRFDRFEFDSATGDLQAAGRRVRLRPQPARALEHLLKRPGELVTRVELQRSIWPEGTFVDFDDGLDSCIKQIRAALGGRRSDRAYVETLVRRGFRFTAPVALVSAEEQPGRPGNHVRVLPVRTLGERETAAHRVARLVEEILAHLNGAAPAEVSALDGDFGGSAAAPDPDAPTHFLLAVTVRMAGQGMLVTSRLVDARGPDELDEGLLLRSQGFQRIDTNGGPRRPAPRQPPH
jgi:DNA-binding winged helix-turn-helix (wHTH) protein